MTSAQRVMVLFSGFVLFTLAAAIAGAIATGWAH